VSKLTQELAEARPDEPFDWIEFSTRLNDEFAAATTSEERAELLAARAVAMEFVVRQLELHGEQLEKFTDACDLEYILGVVAAVPVPRRPPRGDLAGPD